MTHTVPAIVPVIDPDRTRLAATVDAIRARGAVPLIGDDRWHPELWDALSSAAIRETIPVDAAWATFSSGSSGNPRVILRTAESWSRSFAMISELLELGPEDALYLPAPLASSLSLFSLAHARAVGLRVVFPPGHSVNGRDLATVTVLHGTPNALQLALEAIEAGSPSRLRVALIGGTEIGAGLRERAAAVGIRVIAYYGAAELSFVAFGMDGHELMPFPGVEVESRDGELWVRSPFLAIGYLGGAQGSFRRDSAGWATVGDRVLGDPGSDIRLAGRSDGAIVTAGATVVPEDVERALRQIPGIREVVVVGLPHPRTGALVAAVIEAEAGHPVPSVSELRARAAELLTTSHRPRAWFLTENLPRTPSDKPARSRIQQDLAEGRIARVD